MSWYAKVGLHQPLPLIPAMRDRYGTAWQYAYQRYAIPVRKVVGTGGGASVHLWPKPTTTTTTVDTGAVREQSITANTNNGRPLPVWYRTDTPHHMHPHNWDAQCLPDKPCA